MNLTWKIVGEFLQSEYCWVEDGSGNRLPNAVINGDLSAFLATLPEPQPEAPKDWSGHPEYGECRRCEHERVDADKDPCCACCLEYRETGQSPYWQPRTP